MNDFSVTDTTSGRLTPADPAATELLGQFLGLSQCWENDDGSCTVVARLAGGEAVRGPLESRSEVVPGQHYRFFGRWAEHARYGWQFAFSSFLGEAPPASDDGGASLAAYLAKHCDGIGDVTAGKLVAAYGEDVVRTLVEEPMRAAEDGWVSHVVAAAASETLKGICDPALRQAHLELFRLFKGHGFYGKALGVCLRLWRGRAAEFVRRDPFVLLTSQVPGCGFARCDKLYSALRLNPTRLKRQGLAAWYALRMRGEDTWLPLREALEAVTRQIGGAEPNPKRAVAMMMRARWLTYRLIEEVDQYGRPELQHLVGERGKAASERDVALCVRQLSSADVRWPVIPPPESRAGTPFERLSDHQADELAKALVGPVGMLGGTPGTGKTYAAAALIQALIREHGRAYVAVVAPTGKAAVRISEKLAEAKVPITATTIHRLLKVRPSRSGDWEFESGPDNPLPYRFIIVDETSMVDVDLGACLLRACGAGTHLLFVGDVHQLPPVGHGAFLRDLIAAGLPCATLTEIRRNAGRIVRVCAEIKDSRLPALSQDVGTFLANPEENLVHLSLGRHDSPSDHRLAVTGKLDSLYAWMGRQDRWHLVDAVQVITARNVTRQALNRHLQQALNPQGQQLNPTFRQGDKVICLKNGCYGRADVVNRAAKDRQEYVANGDIGRVEGSRGKQMLVRLRSPERLVAVPLGKGGGGEDGEDVPLATGGNGEDESGEGKPRTGCNWDLAYSITIHKSQGSEWPVVIVLVEGAGKLGSRELLYTAISRAKELCLVIGERSELARYVRNQTLPDRRTLLVQLLRGEIQP